MKSDVLVGLRLCNTNHSIIINLDLICCIHIERIDFFPLHQICQQIPFDQQQI